MSEAVYSVITAATDAKAVAAFKKLDKKDPDYNRDVRAVLAKEQAKTDPRPKIIAAANKALA